MAWQRQAAKETHLASRSSVYCRLPSCVRTNATPRHRACRGLGTQTLRRWARSGSTVSAVPRITGNLTGRQAAESSLANLGACLPPRLHRTARTDGWQMFPRSSPLGRRSTGYGSEAGVESAHDFPMQTRRQQVPSLLGSIMGTAACVRTTVGCLGKVAPLRGWHSPQVAEMQPFKTQVRIWSAVLRIGLVLNGPRSPLARMQRRLERATGARSRWVLVVFVPAVSLVLTHHRTGTTAQVARLVASNFSTGLQSASD